MQTRGSPPESARGEPPAAAVEHLARPRRLLRSLRRGRRLERVPIALPFVVDLVRLGPDHVGRRTRRFTPPAQPHAHLAVRLHHLVHPLLFRKRARLPRHVLVESLAGGHGYLVVVPRASDARAVSIHILYVAVQ